MSGSMFGADAEALDGLAQQVASGAQRLEQAGAMLRSQLYSSPWQGSDAQGFRSEWDGSYGRSIHTAVQFLQECADALRRNAQQQRDASGAGVGGLPAGTGGLGGSSTAMTEDEALEHLRDSVDLDDFDKIELENWFDRSAEDVRRDLAEAIDGASPSELAVIADLVEAGLTPEQLTEVLKGGHVWIDDPTLYDRWTGLDDAGVRRVGSSHYLGESTELQYQVEGDLFGEALFGRARGGTWIQLEMFGDKDGRHLTTGYSQYKATGQNLGPWGQSAHTDGNPIILGGDRPPAGYSYAIETKPGFVGEALTNVVPNLTDDAR